MPAATQSSLLGLGEFLDGDTEPPAPNLGELLELTIDCLGEVLGSLSFGGADYPGSFCKKYILSEIFFIGSCLANFSHSD